LHKIDLLIYKHIDISLINVMNKLMFHLII